MGTIKISGNVTEPVVATELAGPSFRSLPRVVEGSSLLLLLFGESLIFLYWRFRVERAEAVGPVAARVLLPLQRLLAASFLMKF